jgi:hypothetical protein
MVVRKLGDEWILVRQLDHALHAGGLADAWSEGGLGPLHPGLVTAARLHDIGWREWDERPTVDPETGGPANFPRVGDTHHAGFYEGGIQQVAHIDVYAGYLVSLHASGIYGGRFGWSGLQQVAWPSIGDAGRRFLAGQVEYRRGLLPDVGARYPHVVEFATVWEHYMLLQALDYLSLQCCLGIASDGCAPVPLGAQIGTLRVRRVSAWEIEVDPFPFPGSRLEAAVPYRRLSGRFETQDELMAALAGAEERSATTAYRAPAR